jgi:hypothetical protein
MTSRFIWENVRFITFIVAGTALMLGICILSTRDADRDRLQRQSTELPTPVTSVAPYCVDGHVYLMNGTGWIGPKLNDDGTPVPCSMEVK